jgi:hypothetical protein
MTKQILVLLLLGMGAGCVELPFLQQQAPTPPPAPAVRKPVLPAAPVTPEEVTDDNAREKADALQRELDRDMQAEPAAPVKPTSTANRS